MKFGHEALALIWALPNSLRSKRERGGDVEE